MYRLLEHPGMALNPFVGSETMVGPSIMLYVQRHGNVWEFFGSFWNVLEGLERLGSIEHMAEEKKILVVSIACGLEPQLKKP